MGAVSLAVLTAAATLILWTASHDGGSSNRAPGGVDDTFLGSGAVYGWGAYPPGDPVRAGAVLTPTPVPTPEPTPAPTAVPVLVAVVRPVPPPVVPQTAIEALVCRYFGAHCWTALQVMWCESGGKPWKTGVRGERGLFQIHPIHASGNVVRAGYTWDQMYEPEPNVAVALFMWSNSGWEPWSCA